jgi:N-acetylmuramoyl-L-alanine amidase
MKLLSPLSLMLIAAAFLAIPVPAASQGPIKLKTVVIDPGHGGKDAGCVSRDKKTFEKNIALDIALRLNRKIASAFPDVDVKMTRSDDRFVELEQLAQEIAVEKAQMSEDAREHLTVSIRADRNTEMGLINDVKQQLRKAGALNINYSASSKR